MFQGKKGGNLDNFLHDFNKREIQHDINAKQLHHVGSKQKGSGSVAKDNNILVLKAKLKDAHEMVIQRERELADLKQTLKFTKIKEFETELALNVQESQRLRGILEREMQR